jgi:hypothetical protein
LVPKRSRQDQQRRAQAGKRRLALPSVQHQVGWEFKA